MHKLSNTIAAISTPAGNGAIAIIRISGKESIEILQKVFKSSNSSFEANQTYYGHIIENNEVIDDVVVSVFKAPKSYTGEDSVEISCHGSIYIQQRILQLLIKNGAQLAKPGEFTMQAFLNGKMDLSQAEAVADLISSSSEASHKLALQQMRGDFSNSLNNLRTELLNLSSLLELELDFSEEDVEFADRTELNSLIDNIISSIKKLTQSFSYGNAIKSGVPVTIVGRTNVGKSTLLNALLKEDKAIVSSIAGTTRDSVEDTFVLQGIQFRFIDTAGLRKTSDEIENEGIKRTYKLAKKAQIVLFVIDSSQTEFNVNQIDEFISNNQIDINNLIVVLNKTDISENIPQIKRKICESWPTVKLCFVSALNNEGIPTLEELLLKHVNNLLPEEHDVVVTNVRHFEALTKALEAANRSKEGIQTNAPTDLVANDIREVIHYLGEITGEISTDDILGNIFQNFCIGK